MSQSGGTVSGSQIGAAGVVEVAANSGVVGAAVATATLPAALGKVTWLTGFELTGAGATAAAVVTLTVTGVSGTPPYVVSVPAGVTAPLTPLVVEFVRPIPATAPNTAIVVSCPSFGAGNTAAAIVAHGFQA